MTSPENSSSSPIPPKQTPHILESLARITIAGVGGALAGLSVAKRRGTFGASTDAILGRRSGDMARIEEALKSSSSSLQLPMTWAIGCTTFAGIVEFSSILSPTSLVVSGLREMGVLRGSEEEERELVASIDEGSIEGGSAGSIPTGTEYATRSLMSNDRSIVSWWDEQSTHTLGDFALGGAVAGAIFKGNSIGASSWSSTKRGDASRVRGGALSSEMASSKVINNIISTVHYKQKQTIGRGRVIKLATKNGTRTTPIKKNPLKSVVGGGGGGGGGRIVTNGNGMVPPILTRKTGIAAGLLPGLILGIVAGLIQISLSRIDAIITDMKLQQEKAKKEEIEVCAVRETTGTIQNETDEKAFEARVKEMTTAEIQQEINALRSRASS